VRFLLIDDSETISDILTFLLSNAGHEVEARNSSLEALKDAPLLRPDCILLDLMMPEMDGFALCKRFREMPELAQTKIIILSGKTYEFDKRRAKQLGADGYIVKSGEPERIVDEVNRLLTRNITLSYWGVRGTLPVPGQGSLRYGGNTSCISLHVDDEPLIVFDAGSGIKLLSDHLMAHNSRRLTAKILISHPHWDHINALPFFVPLYLQGNEIEIIGPPHGDSTTRGIISAQMDDVFFPVTIREFSARVFFRDMHEESLSIGNMRIDSLLLSHPGNCLGYRMTYNGKSLCYITDNELFPRDTPFYNGEYEDKLVRFIREADILITDCTYLDEEYPSKIGWGHSCSSEVARIADRAGVKALHLFHHDPDQNDDAIDRKLAQVRAALEKLGSKTQCLCPAEGNSFVL